MSRMDPSVRTALFASAAFAALVAAPAFAQDSTPVSSSQTDEAAMADGGDIVVTARRREERLLDVPVAVTAIGAQQLDERGALDLTDIQNFTPNTTLKDARGTNSTLTAFIRGVGQQKTKGESAELFIDLMADDVAMTTALDPDEPHPMAQVRVGKEFARDYLESLALNLEMISYPTEQVIDGGDTVVWIGTGHWRDRASGREAKTPKVDVWHFCDGKVVRVLEMFDTLGFARFNRIVCAR